MQSPRRSPRISAESSKRQSPRRPQAITSNNSSGKARASTGGLKADKENDPNVSPTARKAKTVRRAHSVGGELLRKSVFEKDNTLSNVPSRRNVPGPRKSAIRALPPQVFASPTTNDPTPQIRTAITSSSSDSISAFGGSELMDLINSVGPERKTQKSSEGQLKHRQRSSMPSASQTKAPTVVVTEHTAEEDDNTIARKKRRVTFNPYQERTDFYLEEPTMRVRPSGETELVTAGNSTSSHDSSDMSLDSDDSGLQSIDESSMEITAAYVEPNSLLDTSTSDESAMEMTTAYGGVLDQSTTAAFLPSGQEEIDDDSESEQESSDDEHSTFHNDKDMTVTMQFTSVYGADVSESQIEESRDVEEEEEEDNEVDMQLTELDENSMREELEVTVEMAEEDDSAMEMTDIYDQSTQVTSPRKSRNSIHHHSSHLSSPDGTSASPRIGHEYCKIPAAESPKHNLSAATLKALARRQSTSQSPVKSAVLFTKTSLGTSTSSPSKPIFRSSANESRSRQSLPVKSSASPTPPSPSPSPPRPQHSSPAKSPVWKSFRRSQGGAHSPTAKRVTIDPQSPSKGGFGTPRRIAVESRTNQPAAITWKQEEELPIVQTIPDEDRWTMKQFFDSLDLDFLELSMPSKRRVDRDEKVEGLEVDTAGLIKAACAHLPFLDGLVGACEELKSTVIDGRTIAQEDEIAFYNNPPLYVAEMISMTSATERQRAISAFRIQKAAARANALQAYYAWRTDRQFSDGNLRQWEDIRSKLEDDVHFVRETSKLVQGEILPVLRSRQEDLMKQVEMERKRQKALDKCDDEEMNELHRAMEEQSNVLLEQQVSHKEAKDDLERVQLQVKQIAVKQKDAEEAIDFARSSYESIAICTKEEAIRLARQTKHLETLHLWTLHRASLGEIVLELEECLSLTLSIQKAAVSSALLVMSRGGTLWQDTLQQALNERLSSAQGLVQPAEIVRFVTTAWTRMRHFTSVFEVLLARFPAEMETYITQNKGSGVVVRASVLLPRRRSKVVVEARCGMTRLFTCKLPLFEPDDIAATCIYGSVDAPAIAAQIADCVTMGSSAGDLTKAILEAIETFD